MTARVLLMLAFTAGLCWMGAGLVRSVSGAIDARTAAAAAAFDGGACPVEHE